MIQAPTDNIHKFMAVFGLAMVVSGFGLIYQELERARDLDSELQSLYAESDVRLKLSEISNDHYQKAVADYRRKVSLQIPVSHQEQTSLLATMDEFQKSAKEFCAFTAEVVPKIRKVKQSQKYSSYLFSAFSTIIFLGAGVSFLGFRRWAKLPESGQ